jgi:pectate lyase
MKSLLTRRLIGILALAYPSLACSNHEETAEAEASAQPTGLNDGATGPGASASTEATANPGNPTGTLSGPAANSPTSAPQGPSTKPGIGGAPVITPGGGSGAGGIGTGGADVPPGPTGGAGMAAGGGAGTGGTIPSGGAGTTGGAGMNGSAGGSPVNAADCQALVNDPAVNWRGSALQTDQEIVACLAATLGTPIGYGENATGGYNPAGGSQLVVITKGSAVAIEQQLLEAISSEEHKWIVFDKADFAEPTEIAMYRLWCDDAEVRSAIGASSAESCRDHRLWCQENGVASGDCVEQFFNVTLNNGDLPIRVEQIHSNTTIDGRGSQAHFFFSGFKIGADSDSQPTHTDNNVIVTNMRFQGAGHTEDHALDPDMLRSTGASHDIWIHQNTFDLTGDSAWDVKVGAHNITMSSNLVRNVQRACLHASGDSETVSTAITTSMHGNAFVTTDDLFDYFGQGGRRVPLIRFGKSHMFNNVFYNYRREVVSVRVGARLSMDHNMFLVNTASAASRDDDLQYYVENLLTGFEDDGGGLRVEESYVWLSDASCTLDATTSGDLSAASGTTPDLLADYNAASQATIAANLLDPGTELADYVFATAGKGGALPFNAPDSLGKDGILALERRGCQE